MAVGETKGDGTMTVAERAEAIRAEANEAVTALWCERRSEPLTEDTRAMLVASYLAGRLAGVSWETGRA